MKKMTFGKLYFILFIVSSVIVMMVVVWIEKRPPPTPHSGSLVPFFRTWYVHENRIPDQIVLYYEDVGNFLSEKGFQQTEKPPWARTRISHPQEQDLISWFEGSYEGSKTFYVQLVADLQLTSLDPPEGMLFFRVGIDWKDHDYGSNATVSRFSHVMRDWWVTHTYPGMLGRPIEVTGEPHGQTPNQGEGEGEKERSNDGESAFVEINGADETQSGVRSTEVSLQQTAHGLDSMPALLSFRGERISGNQVVVTVFWEIRAEDLKLYPDLTGFQLYAAKPGEPETQEVGGVLLRAHLESEDGTLLFRFPHEAGDDAMVYALAPRGRYGEIGPLIRERLFVPARGADLEAPSQVRAEIRNLEVVSRYVSKRYYDEEQTQLWQVLPYARMNRGRDLIDGLNINYHLNGNVSRMTRMKLGKLHGIMVLFDEDGNVTRFYFGLEGERVTPEEYLEAIGLDAMHDEERKYLKKMPE